MKLNPIQQALLRITSTGQLNQKQLETVSACFLQVAARLQTTARATADQTQADELSAGAFALASIAFELKAGGQTDQSVDYLSRAFAACASSITRTGDDDAEEDDDDERMERLEEQSRQEWDK